jgi:hypothetical protein
MSDCADLIGLRYRLGADGSNNEIDCIHLVYAVLGRLQIPTPSFNPDWYTASKTSIARDLLRWGDRVKTAEYDGDVLLLLERVTAFAVTWQSGILYICPHLEKVNWSPLQDKLPYHCFRSSVN